MVFGSLNKNKLIKDIDFVCRYKFYVSTYHNLGRTKSYVNSLFRAYKVKSGYEYIRILGNAMRHGRCPLKCIFYVGRKRCMLTVEDSGVGFDYLETIKKYENGEVYYQHHGLGTKTLGRSKLVKVDWDKGGRRIIMLYNKGSLHRPVTKIKKFRVKEVDNCTCSQCHYLKKRH